MPPQELNSALIWALRFAYPLTLVILWIRWLPGPFFALYLAGSSVLVYAFVLEEFWWRVAAGAIGSLLQALATFEIAWESFAADLNTEHRKRMLRVMYAMFVLGALLVMLGVVVSGTTGDRWYWYSCWRAALHGATAMMTLMMLLYAGIDRLAMLPGAMTHGVLWLLYTLPALYGAVMDARIGPEDGDIWYEINIHCYLAYLLCLAGWCGKAILTGGRRAALRVS